jgi:hypothetical protein
MVKKTDPHLLTTLITQEVHSEPKLPNIILTLNCTLRQVNELDKLPVPSCADICNKEEPANIDDMTSSQYLYKLRELKIQMYKTNIVRDNPGATTENNTPCKLSDCFWCTCPFTETACHILKYGQTEIQGHGIYCSPECAVAGLFKNTNWDDSEKYESYQLMNHCYQLVTSKQINQGTIRRNICPAVAPHYFLDKFAGNMTIDEFRDMNRQSKHLLYTLDRPLTRILPEIHEEKDIGVFKGTNIPFIGSGKYKVKRQSESVQPLSQMDILRQQFKL